MRLDKKHTRLIVSWMSRSGQSSGVTVAVSGLPPNRTCTTAGLSPESHGPP